MKYESQLQITTAAAVPPLTVNQTALVTNFNADLLDGQHGAYYATAASLGGYLPLTGGTLTGTLTGTVGIFTTLRATELTSLLGSNGPITITPDGTGHVHINSTDIRLGPNNTNATLATRGTGDLILRTNEGSAVEGSIRIYDGANGNIDITPNGTGTVVVGKLSGSTASFSGQITSTVATGTAPLVITSTTAVANLNSDFLDGQHGSYFEGRDTTAVGFSAGTLTLTRTTGNLTVSLDGRYLPLAGGTLTGGLSGTTGSFSGQITSTVATGTAPFVVASTTQVNNLNAQLLGGQLSTYYAAASSLTNYLPLSGGAMTGALALHSTGTNGFYNGTGDAATYALYNFKLGGWNGMALENLSTGGTYPSQVVGVINFREGTIDMKGGFKVNGASVITENQSITISGDASGTGKTAINLTLASVGTAGTYRSVTTDAKGRVTAGTNPTTLAGYGITDALPLSGGTLTGNLALNTGVIFNRGSAPTITNIQCSIFNELNGISSAESLNFRAYGGFKWQYWDGTATWMQLTSAGLTINGNTALHNGTTSAPNLSIGGSAARWATGRTISLTGDVSGTSAAFDGTAALSFGVTIANSAVTYAKIQNVATASVLGNSSASVAQAPSALSMATLAGMLSNQAMNINGSSASCTGNSATATTSTRLSDASNGLRIANPGGGSYATGASTATGAIKIKLPTASFKSNTMFRFTVKIYQYAGGSSGLSRTIEIGGYNYSDAAANWYNIFAYQNTMGGGELNVRFGNDGTSQCVWIGETATVWDYPQVTVTDFQAGYSNYTDAIWSTGWGITFATAFDTVTQGPIVAAKPINSQNYSSYALPLTGGTVSGVVRINNQLQVGQNTNGTAYIDAYGGYAWFGRDSNSTGIRIDGSANVHLTNTLNVVGAITQNGNQVLHAGNYTSYPDATKLPLTGGTLTGALNSNSKIETTGNVIAGNFSGPGTGITGTAASLSIGGTAATATTANALNASNNYQVNSIGVGMAGSGTAGSISLNQLGTRSWSITPSGGNLNFASGDGNGAANFSVALQQGGQQVLHGGNYTSYVMKYGGAPSVDLNTLTTAGVYRINNTEANRPNDWGQLLVMYGGSDTITQIYGHYVDGTLKTRSGNPTNVGGSGSWSPWRTLLGDHNFNSYALPLTGGTLTGALNSSAKFETTGNITGATFYGAGTGITGTAASLTAGAVPWTGVTGKPTTVAGYGITDALPITGGALTGVLGIQTSSDNQLLLQGTDTWAGIGFRDSANVTDYIWYWGATQTFAIGGGGSSGVSGKKLHIDGGVTIGSSYDAVSMPTNGLNVEGAIQQAGNQVLHAGNYATSYLNGTYLRAAGHPGYADWNTFGNTAQTVHQMYQENFNIPTSTGSSNFPTNASYKYGTLINFGTGADARAQVYISHAGNDLVFRGGWGTAGWNTWNRCVTDVNFPSFGTHQASIGNSLPTTVFMSTDANIRQAPFATAKAHLGITSKWANSRPNNTSDSNYWTGAMGWGTTDWNTVFDWGSGFTDSWSGPANNPGDTSHHLGVQAVHYTNGSSRYGWQMVNGAGTNRWWLRDIWGGGFSSWREVIHSGNYTSYAPNINGGSTIGGITYFSNGESIQAYGIRGRFTNEYLHLYNKVGIGNPTGWGTGETNTPVYGLSTYGGINVAYGNNATSSFAGLINANAGVSLGGPLYYGQYTRRQIALSGPGAANFGNWKQFIRLWAATGSGSNLFTLKVSVRGQWNWSAVFGTVEAYYSLYLPADSTIGSPRDFRITHVSGPAADNVRLGDAVIENGYISIPVWASNTNGLDATVEQWTGSQILGTVTAAVSEAMPAFIAPNFRGGLTSDGNAVLHAGNYNSYAPTLTGTGASGTWGVRITGFANQGSQRLYSTDASYNFDSANPYFGFLTYNGTANRWRFKVSPATPDAVEVAYADVSGSANAIADGVVSTTAKIANSVVTYAKIQNVAVSTVLGNSSASVAQAPAELSMSTLAGMLSNQTMNINGSSASCTGNAATATNGFTVKPGWAGNQNLILEISNFNNSLPSGFYQGYQATNSPSATWYNLINIRHSNTANDHGFQLAMSYYDETLWSRSYQGGTGANNGTFTTWRAHLHSGNFSSYALPLTGGTLTGALTATSFSGAGTGLTGTAASLSIGGSAGSVAASGITGQTGMWTSAARPGPYRLYRRDVNDAYSVQNYWTGTYWRLDGYYSNDTVHAGCSVAYADTAGSVSTIADGAVSTTAKLANSVVTYAKIQNVGSSSVLGNTSASVSQAPQEITFSNLGAYINGVARAWVTFNENPSTGAITINASLGISSVTRINYGQYRVNFSTAFADANYAVSGTIGYESNGGYLYGGFLNIPRVATPKTTTYCEVTASYGDGNTYNARFVHVVFDR